MAASRSAFRRRIESHRQKPAVTYYGSGERHVVRGNSVTGGYAVFAFDTQAEAHAALLESMRLDHLPTEEAAEMILAAGHAAAELH